jgi:hypothetical protein
MSKFTLLAHTSDNEYTAVLSVQHPKKGRIQFNKDWSACYVKVIVIDFSVNPVNTCEEQYRLMKKLGWTIKELSLEDPVTLP